MGTIALCNFSSILTFWLISMISMSSRLMNLLNVSSRSPTAVSETAIKQHFHNKIHKYPASKAKSINRAHKVQANRLKKTHSCQQPWNSAGDACLSRQHRPGGIPRRYPEKSTAEKNHSEPPKHKYTEKGVYRVRHWSLTSSPMTASSLPLPAECIDMLLDLYTLTLTKRTSFCKRVLKLRGRRRAHRILWSPSRNQLTTAVTSSVMAGFHEDTPSVQVCFHEILG